MKNITPAKMKQDNLRCLMLQLHTRTFPSLKKFSLLNSTKSSIKFIGPVRNNRSKYKFEHYLPLFVIWLQWRKKDNERFAGASSIRFAEDLSYRSVQRYCRARGARYLQQQLFSPQKFQVPDGAFDEWRDAKVRSCWYIKLQSWVMDIKYGHRRGTCKCFGTYIWIL